MAFEFKGVHIGFICLWCCNWFLLFPIVVYYGRLFWRHRYIPAIKKRRPKMAAALSIAVVINILIIRMYAAIIIILRYDNIDTGFWGNDFLWWSLAYVFVITVNFFCSRMWFFFYDWRYNQHSLDIKWSNKLYLNESQTNIPWTIKYEHILGNTNVMLVISMLNYIVIVLSVIIIGSLDGLDSIVLSIFIIVTGPIPPNIFLLYLYFRILRFYDGIGIQKELKHYLYLVLLTMPFFMTTVIAVKDELLSYLCTDISFAVLTLTVVIRMFRVPELIAYTKKTNIEKLINLSPTTKSTPNSELKFKDILKNIEGLKLFANHLVREYSIDNLLFLIEYHKLKYIIGQKIIKKKKQRNVELDIDHEIKIGESDQDDTATETQNSTFDYASFEDRIWYIKFPEKLITQKGQLQPEQNNVSKHVELWVYLYNTYINSNSLSTINISSSSKNQIINCLSSYNIINDEDVKVSNMDDIEKNNVLNDDCIVVFDGAAREVYQLLSNDSWVRFISKPDFHIFREQANRLNTKD